jgi:hypothetical protein
MAATNEADLIVKAYQEKYNELAGQAMLQQKTIDVIHGLGDKVSGIEDDLVFSNKTFNKQIEDVKNQIQMDKKKDIVTDPFAWVDTLLNYLLIIALALAIFMIIRKLVRPSSMGLPSQINNAD